ncbi:MAG: hypothetical protein ACKV2O_13255 [Acidimicrobiales bacterium]
MRRNILALAVVTLLALGACGGDDAESTSAAGNGDTAAASQSATDSAINDAKSCKELVSAAQPLFVDLFQNLIDETQALSAEELATIATDVEGSGLIKDFTDALARDGAALETKAEALGCSEDDAQSALCQAIAQVDSKGNTMAQTMISGMKTECV